MEPCQVCAVSQTHCGCINICSKFMELTLVVWSIIYTLNEKCITFSTALDYKLWVKLNSYLI